MNTQKTKKVYVSLDSLLDTRLAVLNLISTDFAIDVASTNNYFNRQSDIFSDSNGDTLSKELYNKISKDYASVLNNSVKTKMCSFLAELCHVYIQAAISSPVQSVLELDINTYPYTLTDKEVSKLLPIISSNIGDIFTINCINMSEQQLSMGYISDNYSAMVMYNYHDWLNKNEVALKKKAVKGLVVYVPKIYFGIMPKEEDIKKLKDEGTDPFAFTQRILSPLIEINYLPISLYCIDSPFNKSDE